MTQRTDIQIRLSLQDDASQGMRRFGETLRENSRNIRNVGLALTAMGGAAVFAGVQFARAALEQRRALATLGSVVKAAGDDWSVYREEILKVTAALQAKTNFGDEEQQRALAILTTALGSTRDALAALPLALDAAEASGKDLVSVVNTLGRALAGQTDVSISLNTQFEKGSSFSDRLALGFSKVGGAAEASADPMTQLTNAMGDLQEVIGEALLPLVIPLAQRLLDAAGAMGRFAEAHPALIRGVAIAGAGLLVMGVALTTIGAVLPLAITGVGLLSGAFATLAVPLGVVTAELAVLSAGVIATVAGILTAVALAKTIRDAFPDFFVGESGLSEQAEIAKAAGAGFGGILKAEVGAQFSGLQESIAGVGATLASPFTSGMADARKETEEFIASLGGGGGAGGGAGGGQTFRSSLAAVGAEIQNVEGDLLAYITTSEASIGTIRRFNMERRAARDAILDEARAIQETNLALRESGRESLLARVAAEELAFILDVESQKMDIRAQQIRDVAEARREDVAAVEAEIAAIKALTDLVVSASSVAFVNIPSFPGGPGSPLPPEPGRSFDAFTDPALRELAGLPPIVINVKLDSKDIDFALGGGGVFDVG